MGVGLQVNASPSLTANTQSDYELKCALLNDMLSVVDLERKLRPFEPQIGGFDLVWNNGPVKANPLMAHYGSFLGCINDRAENRKALGIVEPRITKQINFS